MPSKLQFVGESIYGFVRNGVAIEILGGQHGRKWAGFLTTLFLFILIQNLWGIVPLAQLPVTSHFAIPVLLAVMVWVIYMIVGIRKHGFFGFFKLMCYIPGIPVAMHVLLIPIEFLSNIILRPFTLASPVVRQHVRRAHADRRRGGRHLVPAGVRWRRLRIGSAAVRRQHPAGVLRAAGLRPAGLRVHPADRDLSRGRPWPTPTDRSPTLRRKPAHDPTTDHRPPGSTGPASQDRPHQPDSKKGRHRDMSALQTVQNLAEVNVDIAGNIGTLGYGLSAIGPGIGVGIVWAAYITSTARQPESAGLTRTYAFLGFAVSEALALLGFVVPFIL